jgi:hypothetical protein
MEQKKNGYIIKLQNMKAKGHLENIDLDVKIILALTLRN